jgi:biopolymer transport protein ExbD
MLVLFLACLTGFLSKQYQQYPPEHEIALNGGAMDPMAEGAPLRPETVAIDIRSDGSISVSDVLYESASDSGLMALREHLISRRSSLNRSMAGVLIRPDSDVPFQRLIDVLRVVTDARINVYSLR